MSVKMRVIKYSEFALDESNIDSVRYQALLEEMDSEYLRMVHEGKSIDEINESVWNWINKLGGGFTDRLKNYAAGWLLSKLGLPPDNAFLSEFAKNIVEQISFRHIGNYFGEGSCKYWISAITKGLLETLEEKTITLILSRGLGLDINFAGGILGTTSGAIREALTNYLNSTSFVEGLTQKLEGKVCGAGTSFSTVFGGGQFTEKDIKDAAMSGGEGATGASPDDKSGLVSKFWNLLGA